MCGIAGLVSPGGGALHNRVTEITDRLRHRGPDADGERVFGQCTLGHTRLRIIDLSPSGDQPLPNEDEAVWAVFNGEIYNFAELRSELIAAGHRFRSKTDTEVLVHLYEEHDVDMAARLRGMFAFAVWDERRERLLLCRDRLGIKPLYYRTEGDQLAFASEVQALGAANNSVDPDALAAFLRLGWVPGPRTIRAGVSELPPGHMLVWEAGRCTTAPFWSLPVSNGPEDPPSTEELADALLQAMRLHLVADVPVGLFLSSGVDSVVVARLASRVAPGLRTYTVAFDTGVDESWEAAGLARQLDLEHAVVTVGEAEALASVGRFVQDMDQLTVDGLNSWIISRAVREAGLVVALSGLGGDELFGGYSTFRHVPRLMAAGRSPGALRWLGGAAAAMGQWSPTAHWRGRRALEAMAQGGWGEAYSSVRGLFSATELARLWPRSRDLDQELVTAPREIGQPPTAVVGQLEMTNYLPFQLLRDTDCMSMAHALEVRVPLLDDAVVQIAMRGQCSGGRSWGKQHLVAAVDPELDYLVRRPKQTFTLPIDTWMRGRLRPVVEDALVGLGEAGLGFDRRELTDLWDGYLGRRVGWRAVWAMAVLGMWLHEHEHRRAPSSPVPAS